MDLQISKRLKGRYGGLSGMTIAHEVLMVIANLAELDAANAWVASDRVRTVTRCISSTTANVYDGRRYRARCVVTTLSQVTTGRGSCRVGLRDINRL